MSEERKTVVRRLGVLAICVSFIVQHSSCCMCSAAPPLLPAQGIPSTPERIELGKKLFFDRRLSANGTIACADCHQPSRGYSDPFPVALGLLINGGTQRPAGTRRSPTIINAAYSPLMFRDGRTNGNVTLRGQALPASTSALANQALLPLENRIEMGDQTVAQVVSRLRRIPGYTRLFAEAFGPAGEGGSPIDRNRLGVAIAQFEMTLLSFGAPIDEYLAGNHQALSVPAEIGLGLMHKARCFDCHRGPQYTTFGFANNGMLFNTHRGEAVGALDKGRGAITGNPNDNRHFKIPTLREVARRPPYGVDGRLADLAAVVRHYNHGAVGTDGRRDPRLSPLIRPQAWSAEQEQFVVTCLREAFASPRYPYAEAPRLP